MLSAFEMRRFFKLLHFKGFWFSHWNLKKKWPDPDFVFALISEEKIMEDTSHFVLQARENQLMNQEVIAQNLAVVEDHFHTEAANEIEKALDLYTDDIIWESPSRDLLFRGKEATAENYRRMFASFKVECFQTLQRFATETRVVDDSVLFAELVGEGVDNAPVPVGSRVEIRLLHVFEMRDGKISRELVFENWRVIQPAVLSYSTTTVDLLHSTY